MLQLCQKDRQSKWLPGEVIDLLLYNMWLDGRLLFCQTLLLLALKAHILIEKSSLFTWYKSIINQNVDHQSSHLQLALVEG